MATPSAQCAHHMPLGGCIDIPACPRLVTDSRGANCIIHQFYHPLSKWTLILIHAFLYVHTMYRMLQWSPRVSTIEGGHCHDHPTTIRSPARWPHSEYHRDIQPPSDHHWYPGLHPKYSGHTGWSQRENHMASRIYGEVPCGTTVISGIMEGGHMGI